MIGAGRPARWRWLLRGLVVAWLVALALLAAVAPASAHATLIGSDPAEGEVLNASPGAVTFTFDEPVSITGDAVRLFDAEGEELDASSSAEDEVVTADVPDELADGSYVVVWRAVSDDGHPISGSLTFAVGAPSAEVVRPDVDGTSSGDVRVDLALLQGIGYVGLLLAAGLIFFRDWVLAGARLAPDATARLRSATRTAVAVALVAAALGVPLAGAYQQGLGVAGVLEPSAYDPTLIGDFLLVLILQALGLTIALSARVGRAEATVGVAVAVASPALVGHTRAFDPVQLLVLTDAVHLMAGAVWLGGLVGLALTLPGLARREVEAAVLLSRFSTLAAGTLVVVAASGTLMATRTLGAWNGLVDTGYGRLLLVKVGLVVVVVGLAMWNRFSLLPRVSGAVGHDERVGGVRSVRRTVLAEATVLVVLLGVTGFLVNLPPRAEPERAETAPSRVEVAVVGDRKVLVTLTPGRTGRNVVRVQVQDETGEPVTGFAAPELALSSGDVDLGTVPLRPTAAGTYAAEEVLPSAGTWTVRVSVRTGEFDNPVVSLDFEVA